ncbi:MAG: DNA-directed RNA polymerase, subunit E'' [Thermoprotei archaeon]|nr:DNA-directed RNA polymerase, subunit E'' [Thermoprotei archaeon]
MPRRGPLASFMACRKCKTIFQVTEKNEPIRCPNCGSTDISDDWSGLIIIFDPSTSIIAQRLGITKPGRYAIKVR